MQYSTNTINIFQKINTFSRFGITNKNDILTLLETSDEKVFHEIIFTAKFLNGLLNILKGEKATNQEKQGLMPEYTKNIAELTDKIKEALNNSPEELKHFENSYLELNPISMQNYTSLISDLANCKDYFNSI